MYKVREYNPASENSATIAEYKTLDEAKRAADKIVGNNGEVWDENDELCIYAVRVSVAASAMGKKGGSSRSPKKSASSAANLDGNRKGWPKGKARTQMKQTLKDFLVYGLNPIDKNSSSKDERIAYATGERWQGNDNSDFPTTYFTTKREAAEMWRQKRKNRM